MKQVNYDVLWNASLASRRLKAEKRRAKVKSLLKSGLSAPKIAKELNVGPSTVYSDIQKLKKENNDEF